MGFFSSSKTEPRVPDVGHTPASSSMSNVIRSRFVRIRPFVSSLVPKGGGCRLVSLPFREILMTALVFALLKYGKGKERERTAFNDLGNGNLPQDREPGAAHSTLSGQGSASKSFGRTSGRKVKASVSGTSSMPTAPGNAPSTSSRLAPGPRPSSQPQPPRNNRTSADTITYGSLLFVLPS